MKTQYVTEDGKCVCEGKSISLDISSLAEDSELATQQFFGR